VRVNVNNAVLGPWAGGRGRVNVSNALIAPLRVNVSNVSNVRLAGPGPMEGKGSEG